MASSISDNTKSKRARGRPKATGTGTLVGVRLQDDVLGRLDDWIARQPDETTRPEAMRRLMESGLEAFGQANQRKRK
jgi:hypothetical protein